MWLALDTFRDQSRDDQGELSLPYRLQPGFYPRRSPREMPVRVARVKKIQFKLGRWPKVALSLAWLLGQHRHGGNHLGIQILVWGRSVARLD